MSAAKKLTDHDEIRKWAEERGGRPVVVKGTEGGEGAGLLRFDFDKPDEKLREIDWETFFETFEEKGLALLAQEETGSGDTSRFFKFVQR